MRRIAITLVALAGAAAAFAAPAAAYEIDPLTGQPVQSGYGQQPYYGQQYYGYGQQPYDQTYRPQATTIPRQVVPFSSRYGAGTIVISTAERRLSAWCRDRLAGAEELSGVGERPLSCPGCRSCR